MFGRIKDKAYFKVARYFRFWAKIKLKKWEPEVIVVTGSAGKTTLLHLLESQLGDRAHYSHHANSSFGIPLDILGLHGVENSKLDWIKLLLLAPIKSVTNRRFEKIYVAEADVDRPGEGAFLAKLLNPKVTLWVSSLHTHTMRFDAMATKTGKTVEQLVAEEYGKFVAHTKDLVITNGDSESIASIIENTKTKLIRVSIDALDKYKLGKDSTEFVIDSKPYKLPALLPRIVFYQLAMIDALLGYMQITPDYNYGNYQQPPGRSNILKGIRNVTIIDSTYNNSNIDTLTAIVEMFSQYPAKTKWLVVGDMLEQGQNEAREHAKLADVLNANTFSRLILIGDRVKKYTLPRLDKSVVSSSAAVCFTKPADVYDYLKDELKGDEVVLLKGVRYLEGVIEKLLEDKADADKLVRRGPIWDKKRRSWGI